MSVSSDVGATSGPCRRTRAAPASSVVSSSSSVMPMMPFIGVRISWLMFARNTLFAWLAASARSFARASSSCTCSRSAISRSQARLVRLALDLRPQLGRPRVHQPGERPLARLHAAHAQAVAAGTGPHEADHEPQSA